MATSNQEKTYNEFIKFYDLADKLVEIAERCSEDYAKEQFDEVEKMVLYLEESTDKLTSYYVEIVKNPRDNKRIEEIRGILADIHLKTQKCREYLIKVYEADK